MNDNLISRLQAATGPDRELDCEIATAIKFILKNDNWRRSWHEAEIPKAADNWKIPHYTGSIDAAVALVPEGLTWLLRTGLRFNGDGRPFAHVGFDGTETAFEGVAATPVIALAIAALKARQAAS